MTLKGTLANPAGMFLVSLFSVLLLPAAAAGYSLYGVMDFDYNTSRSTTEDTSGGTQVSKSSDFLQRYNFGLAADIFPTLRISADYALEKDVAKGRAGDIDTKATFVRMSPSAVISFRNPFFASSLGYNEVESKSKSQGGPWQTLLQKNVNAAFGLPRTPDVPTLGITYSRSHMMDKDRLTTDSVSEGITLSSQYKPLKAVELRYSGGYSNGQDNLSGVETTGLINAGRVTYSDAFLKNRVRVYSNYDISLVRSQIEVFGPGTTGEAVQPITPFAGLSGGGPLGSDIAPEVPSNDTLISNPLLIDGNVSAGSGINIGFSLLFPDPRNMGLDLGQETELNILRIWINQRLPDSIVSAYSWDIYTSSDTTALKQWTLVQTVAPAAFGVFDSRFELRFAIVTTRFIKAVVRPLASPVPVAGVDINNILVTEMTAAIATPVQFQSTVKETARQKSQRFETGMNVKIADVPNLNYDVYYWQSKTDVSDFSPYTLTNSLNLSQRLSRVFSTGAGISRTDAREAAGDHLIYNYNASLSARPLGALSHTLKVSRMTDETEDEKTTSNFVFFNNTATLYRGISVNVSLSEGDSTTAPSGKHTRNRIVQAGSTLVPNRRMTVNLYFNKSRSETTGGETAVPDFEATGEGGSLSYTPFETLFLFYSYAASRRMSGGTESARPDRTQVYNASWSPSLSGDLWFSITASRVLSSADEGETTTISPQARWNLVSGASLEAGYQRTSSKNVLLKSKTDTFFASLRLLL
jgi:hypothetical protein